jgi:hypothetical protein
VNCPRAFSADRSNIQQKFLHKAQLSLPKLTVLLLLNSIELLMTMPPPPVTISMDFLWQSTAKKRSGINLCIYRGKSSYEREGGGLNVGK